MTIFEVETGDDVLTPEMREAVKLAVREIALRGSVDHDARGMCRDLQQMVRSHERYCAESKKAMDARADHADEQRERIEQKLDTFIEKAAQKDTRQLVAIITLLIAMLSFFLVEFFTGHMGPRQNEKFTQESTVREAPPSSATAIGLGAAP